MVFEDFIEQLFTSIKSSNGALTCFKLTTLNNVYKTKACNVSMLDEQYEVRYPVTELNLEV